MKQASFSSSFMLMPTLGCVLVYHRRIVQVERPADVDSEEYLAIETETLKA